MLGTFFGARDHSRPRQFCQGCAVAGGGGWFSYLKYPKFDHSAGLAAWKMRCRTLYGPYMQTEIHLRGLVDFIY